MPLPKSVTKFSRNGVEFTSSVDRANYLIEELTRAALKDVGRLISRECAKRVRGISKQMRKARWAPKRYQYWVRKHENDLQVGIENTKFGAETAWWADQAELGTNGQPKRGILRGSTYDNIEQIRLIEAQYLSAIEDEIKAESLINEEEEVGSSDV